MYSSLVDNCFDKCVMAGWGGVNCFVFHSCNKKTCWLIVSMFVKRMLHKYATLCMLLVPCKLLHININWTYLYIHIYIYRMKNFSIIISYERALIHQYSDFT